MSKVALVTGGNRGLGEEVCRRLQSAGYTVWLAARDGKKAQEAAKRLDPTGSRVLPLALDTQNSASIRDAFAILEKQSGRLDVLVNNAGILPKSGKDNTTFEATREDLRLAMETNTFGSFELSRLAVLLMGKNGFGRIVNVSSGMGQLSDMGKGFAAYRLSKTALNAVTAMFAAETAGQNILVNSVCPGWVRTEMGGPSAQRSLEQGGESIVWAALLPDGGPTGGFFRDGKPLPW